MKIDKSIFSLALMADSKSYEGTFNVVYKEKIFNKEVEIHDTAFINEESRALRDSEKTIISQLNKLINKELDKRGFKFDKLNIYYSYNKGEIVIEYLFGDSINTIPLSLMEDTAISKKALSLSRSLSKRLLRELK